MRIETGLANLDKSKDTVNRRLERVGSWMGLAAISTTLFIANLSPSAKGASTSPRVKEAPKVAIDNGSIEVDNQPLFPIMSWAQSPAEVEANLDIGINTFMGVDGSQRQFVNEIGGRAYVIPSYSDDWDKPRYFGEIGQHLPDEADGYGILPEDLPKTRRFQATGRLIFQTLTYHYSSREAKIQRSDGRIIDDKDYRDYMNNADVIGTDLYPLAHSCDHLTIADVYHYQKELQDLVDTKPTYQWIEVNQVEGDCGDDPVTPAATRAEVFLAIAGGADGIGYFTHGWKGGRYDRFDVDPKMREALKILSDDIEALTPVVLSSQLPLASGRKDPVKIGGRSYKDDFYMIAINSTAEKVKWSRKLTSTNLGNLRISVLGEDRSVKANNGWISDTFGPYQVRIYRWNPPKY